jgi:putative FmdB family regulatory protein
MPFYEYQCKNCGHDLEAMQKISDPPLKKCPHCGKSQLQRLMSAPVFRLKGGGWYETDFKGDKENQRNLADRPEAEAAKESPTDAAKDTAKEGAAAGAEAKGKDGKADATPAKETPAKETTSKDAPAAKPAEKAPAESAKKVASSGSGKSSLRGRTAARGKTPVRRPIKKPAPKAKRRR